MRAWATSSFQTLSMVVASEVSSSPRTRRSAATTQARSVGAETNSALLIRATLAADGARRCASRYATAFAGGIPWSVEPSARSSTATSYGVIVARPTPRPPM
jgi:hypothetical protein